MPNDIFNNYMRSRNPGYFTQQHSWLNTRIPSFWDQFGNEQVNRGAGGGLIDRSRTFGGGNFNPFARSGGGSYSAAGSSAYNPNWEYEYGGTDPSRVTNQYGELVSSPYSKGAFDQPNFMGFNSNGQPMWSGHGRYTPNPAAIAAAQAKYKAQQEAAAKQRALEQARLGGGKLAAIADILRKQQPTIPPMSTKPGTSSAPIAAPIEYVQNKRLMEGKGFSKFKNQARGTDQFSSIRNIIDQYLK